MGPTVCRPAVPVQHPTAGESLPPQQRLLIATRLICPRHVLGMEDAHTNAQPGEGSHAADCAEYRHRNKEEIK